MNLFNILSLRYGQNTMEEVKSWEGKEHKLTRYKCNLHFNLRCLSQNILPKGIKLNLKQFQSFHEKQIICKTHRSILNSHVRDCNKIVNRLKDQINSYKTSIKSKLNVKDFKDTVNAINKTREIAFKQVKHWQIKFKQLQDSPQYRNTSAPEHIKKKWVIHLFSKPLTEGEQSLLQKGPKIAFSSSKVPLTKYIAVTKRICDELGENTVIKDSTEIYLKTKEILQWYKDSKGPTHNTTKAEWEAIKTLRENTSHVVLTADKGVALVVMDKSQYIDKCMALLDDTKVYKPWKDTTKKLHRDFQEALKQLNRDFGTTRLFIWSKHCYRKLLLPIGNMSPAPRFYGLPKIHKANCPMWPIVSACGTTTYQLAKFLTKIFQKYMRTTPSFVNNSKCFSEYLRSVHIGNNEELVSFDVSALFASIPVPTALDVINRLFTEHIEDPQVKGKYGCSFTGNTCGLQKSEVIRLLKLVLENCVFTFQGNFFKQLHRAAMGSPCSPVVASIYMEYFEDLALGPEAPIPIKEWKRYVDVMFSIIPKGQRKIMLQYLNSRDPHIKFTVEQPNVEDAIPFLDTFSKPKREEIEVSVYRKPTHIDRYLDFNSSHPILAKRAVVRALMDRANNVCTSPDILAKEVKHLNKLLHYNNYPKWLIKRWGKSDQNGHLLHTETGNEIKKKFFISGPYFQGLSEAFKQIFKYTHIQVCFKGIHTLKSLLIHPKDKVSIDQKEGPCIPLAMPGRWI